MSGLRNRFPEPFPPEWLSDYADSVLDPEALRVEVDSFMEVYDRKIAEVGLHRAGCPSPVWPQGPHCHRCHVAPKGQGQWQPVQAPFSPAESWAT